MLPVVKNVSIYSIGYDYLSFVFGNSISNKEQKRVLQVFNRILDLGYCSESIYRKLNILIENKNYEALKDIDKLYLYFDKDKNKIEPFNINLLKSNVLRTHKELQLTCPVPSINLEPSIFNKFEIIKQEYYLEPMASYSFNDLVNYVYSKKKYILLENNKEKRIQGALQYMLNNWGNVNIILFALDKAIEECENRGRKLKDLFDISNYLEDAIKLNQKIINRITYGDIKFVPKKRLLFERSGLLDRQKEKTI